MTIALRAAGFADAERLLAWRNDPDARRGSRAAGAVGNREHAAWLAARLADPGTLLLIAESADGVPVGQVRLDREGGGGVGVVSIAVAPEARRCGHAGTMLAALAARDDLGVAVLRALVKVDNDASLALFAAAGYREVARDQDEGLAVLERAVAVTGSPAGRSAPSA
jgi:RimJ/RimL family protein N-acetyltransferase